MLKIGNKEYGWLKGSDTWCNTWASVVSSHRQPVKGTGRFDVHPTNYDLPHSNLQRSPPG